MNRGLLVVLGWILGAGSLEAQRAWEWQAQGTVVLGSDRFVGAGLGLAFRTGGRWRAGLSLSAGDLGGAAALRAEAGISFHLNPFARGGVTPYGGGGVTTVFTRELSLEYLLILIGVEGNPGGRVGWFLEGGVGGGLRLGAGIRWRRRSRRR